MTLRVVSSFVLCLGLLALIPVASKAQIPSADVQVAATLMAAPEAQRAQATVLGFDPSGQLVTLKAGDGELVCLADDPGDDQFSAACYHESMEPYMARGRELRQEGTDDPNERNKIRWKEAEQGALAMPEAPAALYVLTGSSYDPESGEVTDAYLRFVLYTPWATVESTGLTDRPLGPGSPWLMYSGTAGAHIMVSPPQTSTGGGG